MAFLKLAAKAIILLGLVWMGYSCISLWINYRAACNIGVPVRIIPIDHLNKFWLLVDKQVITLVRRLPGKLGSNNFTRYNYRGWHEKDGTRSHDELGPAFVLCTPSRNWLYVADSGALADLYRRGRDFPRWVEITSMSIRTPQRIVGGLDMTFSPQYFNTMTFDLELLFANHLCL